MTGCLGTHARLFKGLGMIMLPKSTLPVDPFSYASPAATGWRVSPEISLSSGKEQSPLDLEL